jgi:hypothetical protein
MAPDDTSAYLRLNQFLELKASGPSPARPTRYATASAVPPLSSSTSPASRSAWTSRKRPTRLVASEGDWNGNGADGNGVCALASAARASQRPRIESRGGDVFGAFPFAASPELGGCVHVRVTGRSLRDGEISFLRFVASSTGLMLRARTERESPRAKRRAEPSRRRAARFPRAPPGATSRWRYTTFAIL